MVFLPSDDPILAEIVIEMLVLVIGVVLATVATLYLVMKKSLQKQAENSAESTSRKKSAELYAAIAENYWSQYTKMKIVMTETDYSGSGHRKENDEGIKNNFLGLAIKVTQDGLDECVDMKIKKIEETECILKHIQLRNYLELIELDEGTMKDMKHVPGKEKAIIVIKEYTEYLNTKISRYSSTSDNWAETTKKGKQIQ